MFSNRICFDFFLIVKTLCLERNVYVFHFVLFLHYDQVKGFFFYKSYYIVKFVVRVIE